jgi:hypothetical protein
LVEQVHAGRWHLIDLGFSLTDLLNDVPTLHFKVTAHHLAGGPEVGARHECRAPCPPCGAGRDSHPTGDRG